jgi:ribosomal protein S18 acetylase RimI-like enzyme
MPDITRGYTPGCIGRITELHADYYARHAGFGLAFESRVASELAGFCERYEATRDGLWLVTHDGRIEGSIAIDGLHGHDAAGAHLRWFIVSDALRGQGAGRALLGAAMAFVDARGYARTVLDTFEGLDAARRLYEAAGFRRVHQAAGAQWGRVVNEQRFERALPAP